MKATHVGVAKLASVAHVWAISHRAAAMKATHVGVAKLMPVEFAVGAGASAAMKATHVGVAKSGRPPAVACRPDRRNEGHARRRGEGPNRTRELGRRRTPPQ